MPTIQLNGTPREIADGLTIAELLREIEAPRPCAVEVDGTVVPHRQHGDHRLAGDERIEVVTLVGGG